MYRKTVCLGCLDAFWRVFFDSVVECIQDNLCEFGVQRFTLSFIFLRFWK